MEIIISPVATEKTTLQTEKENKITFLVNRKARREDIIKEVEARFDVKVEKVNIMITKNGKKAIVKLTKDYSADEVAGRMGIF
ncbi:50S ribosomal protein L23 [uncultured archaeon]|nr:50S ribosomal protein L23 [uncultured archaeon]